MSSGAAAVPTTDAAALVSWVSVDTTWMWANVTPSSPSARSAGTPVTRDQCTVSPAPLAGAARSVIRWLVAVSPAARAEFAASSPAMRAAVSEARSPLVATVKLRSCGPTEWSTISEPLTHPAGTSQARSLATMGLGGGAADATCPAMPSPTAATPAATMVTFLF